MIDTPFTFVFAAGLVATVNPCGFAMLPAYLSYFLGLEESHERGGVAQALAVGTVVSTGFLVVFGVTGALVSVGLRWVIDYVPWVALVVGIGLVVLGAAMALWGWAPTPVRSVRFRARCCTRPARRSCREVDERPPDEPVI